MHRFAMVCLIGLLSACSTTDVQRSALVDRIRNDVADAPAFYSSPSFMRTLSAVRAVRREAFVPQAIRRQAYAERPWQIGYGQTISDPYIVTIMTAAAAIPPGGHVLEIGTGSGYQAAVISQIAVQVYSIELVKALAESAAARLKHLGYKNIQVRSGDGFFGWPDKAPFDAILVTAGASQPPPRLLSQLVSGGRLIMPIGPSTVQERLMVFHKGADGAISRCVLGDATFVPLTGQGARPAGSMGLEEQGLAYCYGKDLGRWDFQVVPANH